MNGKLKLLYDNIYQCNEQGLYYVNIEGKNYLINSTGKILSEYFDGSIYFENGYAMVRKAKRIGLLGKNGELVLPCIYESVEWRYEMLAVVDEKSTGIIYSADREVIYSDNDVQSIKIPESDRAIICYKNHVSALIDLGSNSIIKSEDAIITHITMSMYKVNKSSGSNIIDKYGKLICS